MLLHHWVTLDDATVLVTAQGTSTAANKDLTLKLELGCRKKGNGAADMLVSVWL